MNLSGVGGAFRAARRLPVAARPALPWDGSWEARLGRSGRTIFALALFWLFIFKFIDYAFWA
jgi:hypothetical protein